MGKLDEYLPEDDELLRCTGLTLADINEAMADSEEDFDVSHPT